ncbi:MAG: helix-turn-helix transcriptional regulator [Saprospiraceae bacterium]|nr:helix-turn-helix transcriptional regulator [Saprospiraceae bacterium]
MDIINLIIKGLTEQLIAESLFISKHTVHSHRKNIFRKLGIHSNSELIRYFIENPLHGIGY